MNARDAAEKYAKGFYCRPGDEETEWRKYRQDELNFRVPAWEELEKNGVQIQSVDHVYTQSRGVTVIVVVKFPYGTKLDFNSPTCDLSCLPDYSREFVQTLLNDEQWNEVMLAIDWPASPFDTVKFIVNESC